MATNAKVTVEDVKKKATEAATSVKAAAAAATEAAKKETEAAKKTATAAKKTATKAATKAVAKAKSEVAKYAEIQYQGQAFTTEDCLKKAEAGFKKEYKGKTLEEINIYIKPEEHKIYYVANKDCVGSVDL